MPHWLIKSALQHAVAVLPQRQRWNALFQRFGTRSLDLQPEMFATRLDHARTHLDNYLNARGGMPKPFTALELGTGWFPTIAVGLYLCGADKIWMVDIDPIIRTSQLKQMLDFFCEHLANGKLRQRLPRLREDRAAQLPEMARFVEKEPPEAFLARFNGQVMVRDAQATCLPGGSVDLFFSSGVIEYIPRPVLVGIFKEFLRLSRPTAVMSHWITLVDQFSYFDRSIGPFNYLRYTSRQWGYLNSPLTWQSRLRISDYREITREAGYEILSEQDTPGSLDDLKKIRLAPEFQKYAVEDLLVLNSWIVSKPRETRGL
jgi:hypothetical protein